MELLDISGKRNTPVSIGELVYLNGTFTCFINEDDLAIVIEEVPSHGEPAGQQQIVKPYRISEMCIAFIMPVLNFASSSSGTALNFKVSIVSRKCNTCTQPIVIPYMSAQHVAASQ